MLYAVIVAAAWVIWHLGFRIRVYGREYLPKDKGFVLAPNHISAIDPVFVVLARFWGRRMLVLGKEEIFQINGFFTWFLKYVGVVAVHRGKGDTQVIDEAIQEVKNGRGMLIFPEGTRSHTGEPGKVKSGAFVVASAANADMIPCRIIYSTGHMRLFCRVRLRAAHPRRAALSGGASLRRPPAGVQAAASGRLAAAVRPASFLKETRYGDPESQNRRVLLRGGPGGAHDLRPGRRRP